MWNVAYHATSQINLVTLQSSISKPENCVSCKLQTFELFQIFFVKKYFLSIEDYIKTTWKNISFAIAALFTRLYGESVSELARQIQN